MPLPSRELVDSAFLDIAGDELAATFGETISATTSDPLLSPTSLLSRNIEKQKLTGPIEDPFTLTGDLIEDDRRPDPDSMMTPEDVTVEFGEIGVNVDEPTPRPAVEFMAKERRAQIVRDDIIQRGPQDFTTKAAQFGAGLGRAFVDPINVASAFIPVVSQARFGGLAARFGTTRARAITGLTEGFVGAAAVEPVVFGLAKELQLDYTMNDALLNLSLGTILGGGLHVTGGAIKDSVIRGRESRLKAALAKDGDFQEQVDELVDILRPEESLDDLQGRVGEDEIVPEYLEGTDPQVREDAFTHATSRFVEGEDVDVEPIIVEGRADSRRETSPPVTLTSVEASQRVDVLRASNISKEEDAFRLLDDETAKRARNAARRNKVEILEDISDAISDPAIRAEFDRLIFGVGEAPLGRLDDPDFLGSIISDLAEVEHGGADMINALAFHVTKLSEGKSFDAMSFDEASAFMVFSLAGRIIEERGLDSLAISQKVGARAASRFGDPQDAEFMLRRFLGGRATAKPAPSEPPDIARITDKGDNFEQTADLQRFDERSQNTIERFDVEAARKLDREIEIPPRPAEGEADSLADITVTTSDGRTIPARQALDEVDEIVVDAELQEPAILEAGRCLAN